MQREFGSVAEASETMKNHFAEFAEKINNIRGERSILFAINPGNWGDSLIREGTERFFNYFEIPYRTVEIGALIKGRSDLQDAKKLFCGCEPLLIINGCGAFTKNGRRVPFMAKMSHSFDETIIFPASYETAVKEEFTWHNTHFFARDKDQSLANVPEAQFFHDMAFFLDPLNIKVTKKIGNFFRTDSERSGNVRIPRNNFDISRKGKFHTPVEGFFHAIGEYEVIRTDRLHVAIAGAILGRNVQFFANRYFKNYSVYCSSMKELYPNVEFFLDGGVVASEKKLGISSFLDFFSPWRDN